MHPLKLSSGKLYFDLTSVSHVSTPPPRKNRFPTLISVLPSGAISLETTTPSTTRLTRRRSRISLTVTICPAYSSAGLTNDRRPEPRWRVYFSLQSTTSRAIKSKVCPETKNTMPFSEKTSKVSSIISSSETKSLSRN